MTGDFEGLGVAGRTNRLSGCFQGPSLMASGCPFNPRMHELAIMDSALNLALDQAQKSGATRLHVIRLRIGSLSGVVPEALQFAFEPLAPGTLAEGAALDIENVPARFWCHGCAR